MKSMDKNGLVIYTSTFSKILSPGFRTGWIVASKELTRKLAIAKQGTDLSTNVFCQYVANEYIKTGSMDKHIPKIIKMYKKREKIMLDSLERPKYTYGLSEGADFRAVDIQARHDSSRFKVVHHEMGLLGEINLPLPGTYNIQNALAAIAVAHHCGIDFGKAAFALDNFTGVVRRFDRILERDDILIVDDYAHHPSEIGALLNAVSGFKGRRVRAVFQPHRFTRSQRLAARFPDAFVAADEVILADIYSALEKPIEGVSTEYLYSFFERKFKPGKVKMILRQEEILTYLKKTLRQGDIVLTIGAGDIYRVANDLASYLRDKRLTYTGSRTARTDGSTQEHAELFEGLRESEN